MEKSSDKMKLLVLSAKEMELPFIHLAKVLGYYVVTTGNAPSQIGHRYADEYIPFDYSDYSGITEMARREGITAVFQGCSDNCALTAAYIGEHLGLKGHDNFRAAEIIHHKDKFKEFAKENHVLTPIAEPFSDKEAARSYEKSLIYPVIVKPNDLAGGQGIRIAQNREQYLAAVDYAFACSHSKNIVVEPYIVGPVHTLVTFLVDQKVAAFGTANDYSFENKFMTSWGLFPADDWEEDVRVLIPEVERIAGILHLVDGNLSMQFIHSPRGPILIEMMRRCPGNHTTETLSSSIGVDWRKWVIRAEAGENVHGIPHRYQPCNYYGYYSLMGRKNGIYKGTYISEELRPYILQEEYWEEPGYEITNYLYEKMGLIQFYFPSEEVRNDLLPRMHDLLKIIVE